MYGKTENNEKSILVNLIQDMLGDYGCHTPIETLLTKQYDNNIPADLARLAGAQMVTAIEANFTAGSCGKISCRSNPSSSRGSSPRPAQSPWHRPGLLAAGARHPAQH